MEAAAENDTQRCLETTYSDGHDAFNSPLARATRALNAVRGASVESGSVHFAAPPCLCC